MAKQQVVVKRLSSLEDLGDVTLLCTDKIGTLTEGTLTVTRLVSHDDNLFQTLVWAATDPSSQGKAGTRPRSTPHSVGGSPTRSSSKAADTRLLARFRSTRMRAAAFSCQRQARTNPSWS
jgi:magnesium-transporting ATPase (P-type)